MELKDFIENELKELYNTEIELNKTKMEDDEAYLDWVFTRGKIVELKAIKNFLSKEGLNWDYGIIV